MVDGGLGGVDVLRQRVVEHPPAEGRHLAAQVEDRKEQPAPEQIDVAAPLLPGAQQPEAVPGQGRVEPLLRQMPGKEVPAIRGVTEPEATGGLTVVAALAQVTARRCPFRRIEQDLLIELAGDLVDPGQPLLLLAPPLLGGRGRLLGDFHADPLAEPAHRFGEGEPLDAHQKGEDVAADAAAEAVEDLPRAVDVEGGGLLAVERAEAEVIGSGVFERQITGNDLDDVGALAYLLNRLFRNPSRHPPLNSTSVTFSPPCSGAAA